MVLIILLCLIDIVAYMVIMITKYFLMEKSISIIIALQSCQ